MAGNTHSETARIPDDARGWDAAQVDARLQVLPWANGYRCVENYEIHAYVKAGGMGSVFRAHHRALRRDYALKFPKLSTPDARARFEREARAGARSSCDHLIHVVHLGHVGTLDFLVMEWVEGGSLKDLVEELPEGEFLPLEEVLRILRGVARALQVLHADGVYHRDVKPANVMYSTKGVVKLADYGLISSDDSQDLTVVGEWAGSPQYAAPEQKRGLLFAKAPADVYSLGATAFYLLVGKPPQESSPSTVPDVRPALAGVPVEVADFVCRCMLLEPSRRYSDGGAVVAALDDLQRRLAARGHAAADGEGVGRRRRAAMLGAVGLVCAAVAALWWGGDPGTPVKAPSEAAGEVPRPEGGKVGPKDEAVVRIPWEPVPGPEPGEKTAEPDEEPTRSPDPPPPPEVQSVSIVDGQHADPSRSQGSTTLLLGKVEYGKRASVTLEIEVRQGCDKLQIVPHEASFTSERRSDGRWRLAVSNLEAEKKAHLEVTPVGVGGRGASHVVHFQVPCITPDLPPLRRHLPGVQVPLVHYRLHVDWCGDPSDDTSALDHHFVQIQPGLLCAVTELSRGQFLQFLDDGSAFAEGCARSTDYQTLMKVQTGVDPAVRLRRLRQLCQEGASAGGEMLPMHSLFPHEAAAFARWLTERSGIVGHRFALPTTEQWRGIANINSKRPWGDSSQLPPYPDASFPDWSIANIDAGAKVPATGGRLPPPPPLVPEPVWNRPQGEFGLCHLGGNIAEMSIDGFDPSTGGPRDGWCLGGSYQHDALWLRVGQPWRFRPDDGAGDASTNLGKTSLGCRLVVLPVGK